MLYLGVALQHGHVPLHQIVAARGARRTTSHAPLFQTMFQVVALERATAELARSDVDEPTVKVDVEMQLFLVDGEVQGRLIYDSALYSAASVERWVGDYRRLLELAVEQPEAPLRTLSLSEAREEAVYNRQ